MVSNLNRPNNSEAPNDDQNRQDRGVRIVRNHNSDHGLIRELLKQALDPLIVDPIPSRVVLNNIDIRKTVEGDLSISCQVYFESEGN